MRLCVDGEISDAGKTEFEIVDSAIDFVLPVKQPEMAENITEKNAYLNI